MDDLGADLFEQTLEVASGERSKGELAEHSQVSLWRNWRQTDTRNLVTIEAIPSPTLEPLEIVNPQAPLAHTFKARHAADGSTCSDAIGLLLPTSLCSGQIAQKCADDLNEKAIGIPTVLSRYTALVHTEGCGVAGEETERIYTRSMLNYLTHPSVRYAFILEHGCEKTHNDFIRHHLKENEIDRDRFGWASIQLDGGIDNVLQMAEDWFRDRTTSGEDASRAEEPLSLLRVGIASDGPVSDTAGRVVGELANRLAGAGGTVIVPVTAGLWKNSAFVAATVGSFDGRPTIPHGGRPEASGLHAMENPTSHWVETLTGLAAAGTDIILAIPGEHPLQGHPLVPVLQLADEQVISSFGSDIDLLLEPDEGGVDAVAQLLADTASGSYTSKSGLSGNAAFQFTRGLLGVSM